MNKTLLIVIVSIVAFAIGFLICGGSIPRGGTVYNRIIEFSEGITVDGTTRIGGTGAATFTSGAFSTTLAVTGESNLDTLIQGGDVTTIGTSASVTLTAAQVCNSAIISITPTTTINVTLPATTTLFADCLTANGDTKSLLFENAATGAATTTTIVAGTGNELLEHDGGDVVIPGNEWAMITFIRYSATAVEVIVTSLRDG